MEAVEVIGIIFGIIGAIVIVRAAWWLICLPFRLLFGSRRRVYYYDEFDWWQDNQGF